MDLVGFRGKYPVSLMSFSLKIGRMVSCSQTQNRRAVNDNLSREQELFERCVQRELGGLSEKSDIQIDGDKDQTNPRPY